MVSCVDPNRPNIFCGRKRVKINTIYLYIYKAAFFKMNLDRLVRCLNPDDETIAVFLLSVTWKNWTVSHEFWLFRTFEIFLKQFVNLNEYFLLTNQKRIRKIIFFNWIKKKCFFIRASPFIFTIAIVSICSNTDAYVYALRFK